MVKHKETCLKIKDKQSVKLRSGSIKFKNHFKQLAVTFRIYADFEFVLKGCQTHIPCSFAYKVVCVYDKFTKPIVLYRGKNVINRFLETVLKEYD